MFLAVDFVTLQLFSVVKLQGSAEGCRDLEGDPTVSLAAEKLPRETQGALCSEWILLGGFPVSGPKFDARVRKEVRLEAAAAPQTWLGWPQLWAEGEVVAVCGPIASETSSSVIVQQEVQPFT